MFPYILHPSNYLAGSLTESVSNMRPDWLGEPAGKSINTKSGMDRKFPKEIAAMEVALLRTLSIMDI